MQDKKEDRMTVYEIGYLIASTIPEENVGKEVDTIRKIITDAGASIISEDVPHRQDLSYTIRRKTVGGSYEKYDQAYFGWLKFEISPSVIEKIKKSVEVLPSIIRILIITTVRENTYLGKHAPQMNIKVNVDEKNMTQTNTADIQTDADVVPATVEEIDKSIDAMVKEV